MADAQTDAYYKERNMPSFSALPMSAWLGEKPPRKELETRRTALVVFASQRQASKCAYVRTRIAWKGAFATHFHHYSKVKKEITASENAKNGNSNSTEKNGHGG